jgi:hypothetical protein
MRPHDIAQVSPQGRQQDALWQMRDMNSSVGRLLSHEL